MVSGERREGTTSVPMGWLARVWRPGAQRLGFLSEECRQGKGPSLPPGLSQDCLRRQEQKAIFIASAVQEELRTQEG